MKMYTEMMQHGAHNSKWRTKWRTNIFQGMLNFGSATICINFFKISLEYLENISDLKNQSLSCLKNVAHFEPHEPHIRK